MSLTIGITEHLRIEFGSKGISKALCRECPDIGRFDSSRKTVNTSVLRRFAKMLVSDVPIIGDAAAFVYRTGVAARVIGKRVSEVVRWLGTSNETTNLTYELDALNLRYLACFVANLTGVDDGTVTNYIAELHKDKKLRTHIHDLSIYKARRRRADPEARYGRRAGWYAIIRALKPRIVVETGVDKGLGSCVIAAALLRNAAEGQRGYYYGTDIKPDAGYLLAGPYATAGEILFGDSIESLRRLPSTVDLFINDSDHSPDYEAAEYEAIREKLSDRAVVLGDNAHGTDKLLKFAISTGRRFDFFQERPHAHWYPGGGIGAAYRPRE